MSIDLDRTEEAAPRATRREWVGLAVLALPTLLLSLDVSVLYLALPQLSADLGASSTQQLWISDIYSFMIAGFLVIMGSLGDRIGRRRLLLVGGAAFAACSVLAAYSTSPEMLIVSRALLGIAGASLMPSTMALIRTMFLDPKQMAVALSIWFSCFMGGMTLGPLVGGALLEQFWWGSAFLLGVPVMLLLLTVGPGLLPEHREGVAAGRLDLASVALCIAAVLPAIYGLKEFARDGAGTVPVATLAIGIALGATFVRRQRRLADPLLDLRLFANRRFTVSLGAFLLVGVVMAGISFAAAQYLQLVLGLSPLTAGLWLIPQNVAMVTATLLAPRLAQRFSTPDLLAAGLGLAGAGLLLLTQVGADGLALQVTALTVSAFGVGVPMALVMTLILAAAPPDRAGSASALSETSGEFGIALGVAALGSTAVAVYSGRIDELLPAGAPEPLVAAAHESLAATAAAVASPATADAGFGDAVLFAAQTAFTSGFNVVGAVGGIVMIAVAVVSRAMLRG
ncbi:MFS transporter [Jiangella asiatica]|uniref:MFS transporter n=1 Tax=Jiangella asiatica TaxID=2530372 RepID=A0A4R5CRQ7_9ACTN|nr:MFS transporter [Jiangella asiatica]TDE02207.1 MFS transporter [Jiangella asiatica]